MLGNVKVITNASNINKEDDGNVPPYLTYWPTVKFFSADVTISRPVLYVIQKLQNHRK